MDIKDALSIIKALADGANPYKGELLETESIFQNPQTVRALYTVIIEFEKQDAKSKKEKEIPERQGQGWEEQEDQHLIDAFNAGTATKEIAEKHRRTSGAIRSRLKRLGLINIEGID